MIHESLQKASTQTLMQLQALLLALEVEKYRESLPVLSGGTIGKHVRHILEFYICLFEGLASGVVDYEARRRDPSLETEPAAALTAIGRIADQITSLNDDCTLLLNVSYAPDEAMRVPTTLYRELIYNLEHSIHHQATIRIGVQALGQPVPLAEAFGVAPSTLFYQQRVCAR